MTLSTFLIFPSYIDNNQYNQLCLFWTEKTDCSYPHNQPVVRPTIYWAQISCKESFYAIVRHAGLMLGLHTYFQTLGSVFDTFSSRCYSSPLAKGRRKEEMVKLCGGAVAVRLRVLWIKAVCHTEPLMGKRVAYHQPRDLFVPSLNNIKDN